MAVVIDTSVLIDLEQSRNKLDPELVAILHAKSIHITSLTLSEFWLGLQDCPRALRERMQKRLSLYRILNTTSKSSRIFAELKHQQKKVGRPVPDFDLLIASIVIDNDFLLVTRDRHFSRVKGLRVTIMR